jgi:hypothetical protein
MLAKLALPTPPSTATIVKDRRPGQLAACEKLAKIKLRYPASYKRVSEISETGDNGAQRTFEWTFSGQDNNGRRSNATAICNASNYMEMATVEVKLVE